MSLLFSSQISQKPRIAALGSSTGRVRQPLHQLVSEVSLAAMTKEMSHGFCIRIAK